MWHQIRILISLAIVGLVAGCKVAVIVVEGGEVKSIGSGTCLEGEICIVQVIDTNFSDAFTAVPNPGWHFVKWNSGEGFFCGDSTDPTCTLSAVEFDGNEGIEALIASDQTFYLMPIFEPVLEPDTVTVDDKEWAQVDQFTNLSWNDINAVCPAGVCSGILNGYNMTGWTWASFVEFEQLINAYEGPSTGDVDRICEQFETMWVINSTMEIVSGYLRIPTGDLGGMTGNLVCVDGVLAYYFFDAGAAADGPVGAWFWRLN